VKGRTIEVTIHRAGTELSDIDLATLKDVQKMIADRGLCQKYKRATWRAPGSMEAMLWEDICDALAIRNLDEEKDKRIAELEKTCRQHSQTNHDLRLQLASAFSNGRELRRELDDAQAEIEDLKRQLEDLKRQMAAQLEPGIGLGLGLDEQTDDVGNTKFVIVEIVHGFGAHACGKFHPGDVVCCVLLVLFLLNHQSEPQSHRSTVSMARTSRV